MKRFLLLALALVGCMTSPDKSESSERYLLGASADLGSYVGYAQIFWVNPNDCSVENRCLASSGDTLFWVYGKDGDQLFVQDSVYENRMKSVWFKNAWAKNRMPSRMNSLDSLKAGAHLRIFDESPKCLNIDQPEKDTVVIGDSRVIAEHIHIPCMPYKTESEMTRISTP